MANLTYSGKRYRAYGNCDITDDDLKDTTRVIVEGDENSLTDILIQTHTKWGDRIGFTYMGPTSS